MLLCCGPYFGLDGALSAHLWPCTVVRFIVWQRHLLYIYIYIYIYYMKVDELTYINDTFDFSCVRDALIYHWTCITWRYNISNVYDTCISNSVCISYANSARTYICMYSCRLAIMFVGLTLVILVKIITNTPPDRHSVGLSFIMWYLVWNRTHPSLVTVIS